jgi:(p)ppGpp synthase/HD superfamily hydrolase
MITIDKQQQMELAFQIAKIAFKDKVDKGGKLYFEHLLRVAKPFEQEPHLYIIGILHDLLEDCPEWTEKALSCLFDKNIVDAIVLLTKLPNEDYFQRIDKINESSWATKVKLSDLKDNMDITRLKNLTEKDFKRLQKYLTAYKTLTK